MTYAYSSGTTVGGTDACLQLTPVTLLPNTCYTLCAYAADAKAHGLASGMALEIQEYDSGGGGSAGFTYSLSALPDNPSWDDNALTVIPWTKYCYTFTTAATTVQAYMWISATAEVGGANSYIVVDDVSIEICRVSAGTGTNPSVYCQAGSGITNLDLFNQLASETTGGVWSQFSGTSVGSALHTTTGILNLNGLAFGTYIFRYTVTGSSPCVNDTEDITVTINACCPPSICLQISITRN